MGRDSAEVRRMVDEHQTQSDDARDAVRGAGISSAYLDIDAMARRKWPFSECSTAVDYPCPQCGRTSGIWVSHHGEVKAGICVEPKCKSCGVKTIIVGADDEQRGDRVDEPEGFVVPGEMAFRLDLKEVPFEWHPSAGQCGIGIIEIDKTFVARLAALFNDSGIEITLGTPKGGVTVRGKLREGVIERWLQCYIRAAREYRQDRGSFERE